jgi:hypothetical protein
MKDDSIEGIYDTLKQCALISKSAGGIGVAVSCIRANGSYIAGVSICPMTSKMGIQIQKQPCLWSRGHSFIMLVFGRSGFLFITR